MKPMYWIIISLVLMTAEMVLPGAYLLWLGAAAALTCLFSVAFDINTLVYQSLVFSLFALVLIYLSHKNKIGHRLRRDNLYLNQKQNQLVGRTTTIPEGFSSSSPYLWIDDTRWTVCSKSVLTVNPGDRVKVLGFVDEGLELGALMN